jgi:hypothetical protein
MIKTLQIILTGFLLCITGVTSAQITLPYFEDFEAGDGGWANASADTLTNWEYGIPAYNQNTGAYSGSNCWDTNLDTSYFIYSECSLTSPVITTGSNNNMFFSFWMNYNTEDSYDGVRLEMSKNSGAWETVDPLNAAYFTNAVNWYTDTDLSVSGEPAWEGQSNGWQKSSIQILNVGNSDLQFRFVFNSDLSIDSSGVSIDDISIIPSAANDMGLQVMNVGSNVGVAGLISDSLNVQLVNYGNTAATGFTISYNYNGSNYNTLPYAGSINSGDSVTFRFAPFTIAATTQDVCVSVVMPGDTTAANNSKCAPLVAVQTVALAFADNFDAGAGLWTPIKESSIGSAWELGTPAYGATNISYSAPACWDIDLDTAYVNFTNAKLYSPNFDCSNTTDPAIDFYINYDTEEDYDGMYIEYSSDLGRTWSLLGTFGDPNAINWYNVDTLTGNGNPAWSGASAGFERCRYVLNGIGNPSNFMMRFVFISDYSLVYDGFSIDNFSISSTTGLAEGIRNAVNVYPNPTKDVIRMDNMPQGIKSVWLQDATGKIVSKTMIQETSGNLSLQNLEPGLYLLIIEAQDGLRSVERIIKS